MKKLVSLIPKHRRGDIKASVLTATEEDLSLSQSTAFNDDVSCRSDDRISPLADSLTDGEGFAADETSSETYFIKNKSEN